MDTPENAPTASGCHMKINNISAICSKEDSGYITTTPCSAGCPGSCSTSVEAVRTRKLPWKNHDAAQTPHQSRIWFHSVSPSGKPYYMQSKPKSLLRDAFITDDIVMQDDSNPYLILAKKSEQPLSDSYNKVEPIRSFISEIKSPSQKKGLKRQIAVEEVELYNSPSTSNSDSAYAAVSSKDSSVSEVLKNLAVTGSPFEKSNSRLSHIDETKCDATSSVSHTSDYVSSDQITPAQNEIILAYSSSPPSRKKAKRSSFSDGFEYLQRTPEKSECHVFMPVERKSIKRLNFNTQPLGTPEKNEILYPSLPVTPPKKQRTPEKVKFHSKAQNLRVSRQLLGLKRQSLCGRENVDFLKMLGQQQNQRPAVQIILEYLNGDDISRMCMVSKIWKTVCIKDRKANLKRKAYLDDKRLTKENSASVCYIKGKQPRSFSSDCQSGRFLMEIQNQRNILPQLAQSDRRRSPPVSPSKRRFRMFVKAASMGPCQLTTCLRCGRPAKVARESSGEHWAQCEHYSCGYTFCRRCLCERHENGQCTQCSLEAPSPSKPKSSACKIGSKQSKRNLRRL